MERKKMYLVYVSYPYSDNPKYRTQCVKAWSQTLLKWNDDLVLIVPHFVFDAIWDYPPGYSHPEIGVQELEIISRCDIFTYDPNEISTGVRWEMCFAEWFGIPIIPLKELNNGKRP